MFNNDNFLYIDYECNKTHNFYALGYGNNEHTKQIILNKELIGFAKYHNLKLISPIEATIICLEEAYKKNYIIVAYSLAEKEYFSYLNKENLLNKYKDIPYLNLAKAAKKWIKKYHFDNFNKLPPIRKYVDSFTKKQQIYSLASIMRLTSFHPPSDYAPGKTTTRFNHLIKGLVKNDQKYYKLTSVQKSKGTKALKHNKFDVNALKVLNKSISDVDNSIINKCITKCLD